jgi:hypothetical protein
MLFCGPPTHVHAALAHTLQGRVGAESMDWAQIGPSPPTYHCAHVQLGGVVLPGLLVTRCGQGLQRYVVILQRCQGGRELWVTRRAPLLVTVGECKGLTQRQHLLAAVVTRECCSHRLLRRFPGRITGGRPRRRIRLTGYHGPPALHPGPPRDGGAHVMPLQVHWPQGLLHVLEMSGRILQQALPGPQGSPPSRRRLRRMDTAPQSAIWVQRLHPLGLVDSGLTPRNIFDRPRLHQQDF